MHKAALRELLATKLGLDAEVLGPSFLDSLAQWCREQRPAGGVGQFVKEAQEGGEAWLQLVEHVVVSETWFFRDSDPFDYIVETVRGRWTNAPMTPVRILSCPCSTGEEAYSVAIALIRAGLPQDAFLVDAADISQRAILSARAGLYRTRSFRNNNNKFIDRGRDFEHDRESNTWRIKPEYKRMVRFHVANMVTREGLEHAQGYDIVLCRNLLIYLHEQARRSVMASMGHLLRKDGILIVGHAEPAIAREHGFNVTGRPRMFAFARHAREPARTTAAPAAEPATRMHIRRTSVPLRTRTGTAAPPMKTFPTAVSLEKIRQLADCGHTQTALKECEQFVRRIPDSAEGHFLLGVLHASLGHTRASEEAFRRAIYLDPTHDEARLHRALAHNSRGESARAARLLSSAGRGGARKRGES